MLPEWAGWTGLGLTVVFGGLNVIQLLINKGRTECATAQIEALRTMCEEAVANEEIINTPPTKQFVRSVAFQLRGIERGLKGAKSKAEQTPSTSNPLAKP
jgi:hypothetical protein